MPPVVIVGIAVAVGAATAFATWLGLRAPTTVRVGAQPVPVDVLRAVLAVRQHQATAAELRDAAVKAARHGHASLAVALRDEAAVLAAAEAFADAAGVTLQITYPSPLRDVDTASWTTYVQRSRVARPSAVAPDGRLGCYALTARELADAGWMLDARKALRDGRLGWTGTWADGRSEAAFLADPAEQYEALTALAKLHGRVLVRHHEDLIGQEIEGQPATLSGLLGVCRRAGLGGLRGWAADAAQRKKFPETTAAYARLNGIF
jgi:hypothetical protein